MKEINLIKEWAKSKKKKELVKAITQLIERAIDMEEINFHTYPYCSNSGEPLVSSDESKD